ncbi:MAG: hypothetical protein JNG90_17200 [Planctomycetaceae bacterium]|nr:hypothetical protein [Planctomycetaceae bacterium]
MRCIKSFFSLLFALTLAGSVGCGSSSQPMADAKHDQTGHDHAGHDHAAHDHAAPDHTGHAHGAWWCDEHGVPEEVCALCDPKLVAGFKANDDWCEKHERPDSQCFACHPEREAEFAAQYEAKYGKQPPKPAS